MSAAAATATGAAVRFRLPPLLFIGPLLVLLAVNRWVYPLTMPNSRWITVTGVVLVVAGVALSLSGAATVLRHRSTLAPHHRVSRLVTSGPFRITRNPMYTGHVIAYPGVALWVGSWWPLFALPLCVLATLRWVILPEEEYLSGRFGDEYRRYCARVRRWL